MRVNLVIPARDISAYIEKFLAGFISRQLEKPIEIFLVVIENGSTDDTVQGIFRLLDSTNGVFLRLGNTPRLDSLPRIARLAEVRNLAKKAVNPDYEYTVLLDADIYAGDQTLGKLVHRFSQIQDVAAMLCAFGIEAHPQPGGGGFVTAGHYYDTFAFVDASGRYLWPNCSFPSCKRCKNTFIKGHFHNGLLRVRSAFGGMATLKTSDFLDPEIRYTAEIGQEGAYICEHRSFCTSLALKTKRSIFVDTETAVLWDRSTFGAT